MHTVERDLMDGYRKSVYRRHGLYDDAAELSSADTAVSAEELEGIEIRLSNVAMSGPLFRWAVNDEIGTRFDYIISKDGEVKQHEENVHRCTRKQSRTFLWNCGVVSYYLKYF